MGPLEPVELQDAGLLLRPWCPTDATEVHRACQDPDIQRWTTVPSPYLPQDAAAFVTSIAPDAWAAGTGAPFAVCDAGTGQLLGSCGLVTLDRTRRSAEVGYWTAPWARGQGVAVRATQTVARWAFDKLGLRRIVWQAEIGNQASRLVALRAGFRIEGQLRLSDPHPRGVPDGWVGSLLPGDPAPTATGPTATGPRQPPTATGTADRTPVPAGPAGTGSLAARRAAVFGQPQPVLFAGRPGGDEIRLRPLSEQDLDPIVAACRDPETVRWTTVPDPYQRSDAEFFVREHVPALWARGAGATFAITGPDDEYLGGIDLRLSLADPVVADLGFLVAPPARGRGYCPAAVIAVCTWGFTALDLARIEWRANVGNTASRRAAEKAGFVLEGTARHALDHRGVRTDVWVGALLPSDLGLHPNATGLHPSATGPSS